MNKLQQQGLQDDEAVLMYLKTARNDRAWQLVYTIFKNALNQQFVDEVINQSQFSLAFSTWLDDLKNDNRPTTLSSDLWRIFLSYCSVVSPKIKDNFQKLNRPYLAKQILIQGLTDDRDAIMNILAIAYHSPTASIISKRQPLESFDFADAYQESLLALLKKPPVPNDQFPAQLFSFFFRIFLRRVHDQLRKKANPNALLGSMEDWQKQFNNLQAPKEEPDYYWANLDEKHNIANRFVSDDLRQVLLKALEALGGKCKKIIHERYILQKKFKEIAALGGFSTDAVGTRIQRCLKKLRALLKGNQ